MVDRIEQLITTLEQEINDGYNTLPDYQANNEGKTYVNGAQATLYELQKQVAELSKISGLSVEDAKALEGYCGDPEGPEEEMRPCTLFNSASSRAALKLKYKPKIVDGKATSVEGVLHRFTFIMAEDD